MRLDIAPNTQGFQLLLRGPVVKPKLHFFQEQRERPTRDAVVTAEPTLGLVPEVLDAVDVFFPVGEVLRMVNAHVMKLGDIQTRWKKDGRRYDPRSQALFSAG